MLDFSPSEGVLSFLDGKNLNAWGTPREISDAVNIYCFGRGVQFPVDSPRLASLTVIVIAISDSLPSYRMHSKNLSWLNDPHEQCSDRTKEILKGGRDFIILYSWCISVQYPLAVHFI